jgi:hypothetical protein
LKETESEHNKVIYHTIMWLNWFIEKY